MTHVTVCRGMHSLKQSIGPAQRPKYYTGRYGSHCENANCRFLVIEKYFLGILLWRKTRDSDIHGLNSERFKRFLFGRRLWCREISGEETVYTIYLWKLCFWVTKRKNERTQVSWTSPVKLICYGNAPNWKKLRFRVSYHWDKFRRFVILNSKGTLHL